MYVCMIDARQHVLCYSVPSKLRRRMKHLAYAINEWIWHNRDFQLSLNKI